MSEHHHEHHHHERHHGETPSKEEAIALLKYMVDHNRHHASELYDLADAFDEDIAAMIFEAVKSMEAANEKLAAALAAVNGEG